MIGAILREYRKAKGLKLYEVAARADVTPMTLSRLERNVTRGKPGSRLVPYWDTVCQIADALELSLDDLRALEKKMLTPPAKPRI